MKKQLNLVKFRSMFNKNKTIIIAKYQAKNETYFMVGDGYRLYIQKEKDINDKVLSYIENYCKKNNNSFSLDSLKKGQSYKLEGASCIEKGEIYRFILDDFLKLMEKGKREFQGIQVMDRQVSESYKVIKLTHDKGPAYFNENYLKVVNDIENVEIYSKGAEIDGVYFYSKKEKFIYFLLPILYSDKAKTEFSRGKKRKEEPKEKKEVQEMDTLTIVSKEIEKLEGVEIEKIGSWLWVRGEKTKEHRQTLKDLSLRWSPKRQAWYYFEGIEASKKRKGGGKKTMDEIRAKYKKQA